MGNALIYTTNFFSWAYRMLTGFVLIPDVLTLFDVLFYMLIVMMIIRFIFGVKSHE